jgi:hypothetical protein
MDRLRGSGSKRIHFRQGRVETVRIAFEPFIDEGARARRAGSSAPRRRPVHPAILKENGLFAR